METAYESEIQLGQLFKSLGAAFARLAKGMDPAKEQQELKDTTKNLTRAKGCVARRCYCVVLAGRLCLCEQHAASHCRLIRDFEKEARADDMRPSEVAARKRELTEQLNELLELKKQHAATAQSRAALFGAKGGAVDDPQHSRYDSEATCRPCVL